MMDEAIFPAMGTTAHLVVVEAAPAGRVATGVTQPARVVRRASAASTTQSAPAAVTANSGS
jgi:hypothetical protein